MENSLLSEPPSNKVTYKSTRYLLWMPKSKERILDDAKQLNEEDLFWFISELIKHLEKANEENKEDELGEDPQPIISL